MSETSPRRIGQSILAVLAGFVAVVILSIGTDVALMKAGIFPPFSQPALFTTGLLLLATAYRSVYSVAGSYLAARLAPDRPMGHALALGVVGLVVSIAGAIIMREAGPAWYPLALVVIAMPCAWLGGTLYRCRHDQKQ
jgi:hypothetical protein